MTVTNQKLRDMAVALKALDQVRLPVLTSLQVAKLKNAVFIAVGPVEETRDKLIVQYADRDEQGKVIRGEGNSFRIAPERMEAFAEDYKRLLAEEAELPDIKFSLPMVVSATCDKCHHNMDRPLELEPSILSPLLEFIDIDGGG